MEKYAVIVAGGSGSRMKSAEPKQFITIGGIPVLMRTIKRFSTLSYRINIIVVLPKAEIATWEGLIEKYNFQFPHQVVHGGETRTDSVKNGLATIKSEGLVAIHDGVRPFASKELITNCYNSAQEFGSGVAAVTSKDSIRVINDTENHSVDRSNYRLIQTPQTFRTDLIKKAFLKSTALSATDDATIFELAGQHVNLIHGEYTNIKITTPEDIAIAQALIENDLVP